MRARAASRWPPIAYITVVVIIIIVVPGQMAHMYDRAKMVADNPALIEPLFAIAAKTSEQRKTKGGTVTK